MNVVDFLEHIRNGENSGVEFKRDDVHPDTLAKEMSALLNFQGGYIFLGVEDSGSISGLARKRQETERWVMDIAHNNIQPSVIPSWTTIVLNDDKEIGVVHLQDDSPGKPYKAKRGNAWVTFIRRGSTSREATRDEEARLYQDSHFVRYDIIPVIGTSFSSLDKRRLENYFETVLERDLPSSADDTSWIKTLVNIDIMADIGSTYVVTTSGLLLFGRLPNRHLPQAGVTAVAFPGHEKDYNTTDEEIIRGPLVSILGPDNVVVEKGVIDRAVDFVARNTGSHAWLDGGRRRRKPSYPAEAIRESIVNAVAHRDYTLTGTDIEIAVYDDRVEFVSPGRLPNGVTVAKMSEGLRSARNELLKEILRDYGYVEHFGLGVRRRIIGAMRSHNGTDPDLIEDENRFTVRLWKKPH